MAACPPGNAAQAVVWPWGEAGWKPLPVWEHLPCGCWRWAKAPWRNRVWSLLHDSCSPADLSQGEAALLPFLFCNPASAALAPCGSQGLMVGWLELGMRSGSVPWLQDSHGQTDRCVRTNLCPLLLFSLSFCLFSPGFSLHVAGSSLHLACFCLEMGDESEGVWITLCPALCPPLAAPAPPQAPVTPPFSLGTAMALHSSCSGTTGAS